MKRLILLGAWIIIFSCKNEPKKETIEIVEPEASYEIFGNNLLKNPRLKNWDTDAKPTNWEINDNLDLPEKHIVYRDSLDPLLKGDNSQLVYIKQKVSVTPNTYYLLKCELKGNVISNKHGGISINTQDEKNTIGEAVFQLKNKEFFDHKVIFNSNNNNEVSVYIGFFKQGGGQIQIKGMSIYQIDLNFNSFNSTVAQNYHTNLNLNLSNDDSFNNSIVSIIKHTSDLLLNAKRKDSSIEVKKNETLKNLNTNSKFKGYLESNEDEVTNSFALKLVESSIEILDEFNIGTQRVELYKDNLIIRTLIKYYNPFSETWITFDPYFNAKILLNNDLGLIKKENIEELKLGGLSNNWDVLIDKYSGTITIIKKEKLISFPY